MVGHNLPVFLTALLACRLAFATPTPSVADVDISVKRMPRSQLLKFRQDVSAAAFDVNVFTALGDSFSAGPSAGTQRNVDSDDYDCSRYDQAFPQQLNGDPGLLGPTDRPFHFKACTGAVLTDVINNQLPSLDPDSSLITMTIGGNDVGFGSIVNNCIYGFKRSAWIWGCDDTINWARNEMQGDTFKANYDSVMQGIWDTDPGAHIYILGYPAFFNVDTDYCSSTCFAALSLICPSEYILTKERRQSLNDLTALLNDQVRAAISRNPPPEGGGVVEFIDTNPPYDTHRFCEDGVKEPDYNNKNIWFYPFTYYKRDWVSALDQSDCDTIEIDHPYTGDIGHLIACGISGMTADDPSVQEALDNNAALASTEYPDPVDATGSVGSLAMFQRIFHPTVAGMTSFKDDVVFHYQNPVVQSDPPADPPADDPPADDPPPEQPQDHILCGLGNYWDASVGPIGDGISYLQDHRGEMFHVDGKSCSRPSCSYGTGMQVCNDGDDGIDVDLGVIGDRVNEAKDFCNISTDCSDSFCGYYGLQCCSDTVKAFQHFTTDGYNVLITGGFDC